MAASKAPAKKAAPKTPVKAAKGILTKEKKEKPAPQPEKPAKAPTARRPAGAPAVQKTRVVFAMAFYDAHKDTIKAPFKEQELKWNFLGEGKGLYKRPDSKVHCFTQFKDDGVHYSVWGDDKRACDQILGAWRTLLGPEGWAKATETGEQAFVDEKAQAESEAVKLWRMGEPQRRPGEPDLFFEKRLAEWKAKRPA